MNRLRTYITRRLIHAVIVLFIVSVLIFSIMRLLPGDPILLYLSQSANLENMNQEMIDALTKKHGLDQPLPVQYFRWLTNIFRGDWGRSIFYNEDIGQLMLERFPVTLHLSLTSVIVSTILGILIGLVAAVKRGKLVDKLIMPLTYLGISAPVFWVCVMLMYVFGVELDLLPIAGYTSPFKDFWFSVKQSIMPITCMAIFGIAGCARQMRSSVLEVLPQDYIRTAWSKGLKERQIVIKHVLKNSLSPVVTFLGVIFKNVIGGSVLVETIFAIPGVGRLLVSSIFAHDYVVGQSITFVIALLVLLVNIIVDLSYGWLDPRVRFE